MGFFFRTGLLLYKFVKSGKIEIVSSFYLSFFFLFNGHWLSFITMIRDVSFYTVDSINAIRGKQQVITFESRWNSPLISAILFFSPKRNADRSIDTCGISKIQQGAEKNTPLGEFFHENKMEKQ